MKVLKKCELFKHFSENSRKKKVHLEPPLPFVCFPAHFSTISVKFTQNDPVIEPNTDSSEVNKNKPTKIQIHHENQEKIEKNQYSKSNTPERVNKRAKLDNENTSDENNLVNPGEKSEGVNYRRYSRFFITCSLMKLLF